MENMFFAHQIKRTKGTIEKGIVVKNTYEAAKQTYHAYLGAYAYNQHKDDDGNVITDFVSCHITDMTGTVLMTETWIRPETEQPIE